MKNGTLNGRPGHLETSTPEQFVRPAAEFHENYENQRTKIGKILCARPK